MKTQDLTIDEILLDLCTRWATKWPAACDRIASARLLVMSGGVVALSSNRWTVRSERELCYEVRVTNGYPSCQCADHLHRRVRCKHIWAAALSVRLAEACEEALPEPPRPAPRASLNRKLGEHCANLHRANAEAAKALPVAPVIPFKRSVA